MKFAALSTLMISVALVAAQDPQGFRGLGAECKKNRDCCPCDTGSVASLYCNPDKSSSTGLRCTKLAPTLDWCKNHPGKCGNWDQLSG
ncbi:uncharacterized protein CTRU02_208065 [Colletotrichum truncatum]|uniref:Uncharacterized protein n=1 Tax=Colletotrichum truncatum TaxID=5467 RepID=A0ACC3YV80_COLTU|nr:uncharacterized protein CTRU02_10936 [Colletotrichum truncatum]KAF6786438.1 hypothetical protein CTRU02_10936 [Colletotrichum truncatum]